MTSSPKRVQLNHSANSSSIGNSIIWVAWFSACFIPLVSGDGIGYNYLFVLTPLFYALLGGRLYFPGELVKRLFVICIFVFAIASLYQFSMIEYYDRRVASFFLFLSIFALTIIRFSAQQIKSFYISIMIVSLFLSLKAIYGLLIGGLVSMAAEAKDEIGSQRVGFIYIVALWTLFAYYFESTKRFGWVLLWGALVVVAGLILTFSRASIVALMGSIIIYLLLDGAKNSFYSRILRIGYLITLSATVGFVIYLYVPAIYDFFDERLFSFIASGAVLENMVVSETSEGTRIAIWTEILNYITSNPLTGSGFLGTWSVNSLYGSAHNQYFDTLLRLGLFGFAVYLFILIRIGKRLMRSDMALFAGYAGLLLYGLFHETFKEPAGALILSFLMSAYLHSIKQGKCQKQML